MLLLLLLAANAMSMPRILHSFVIINWCNEDLGRLKLRMRVLHLHLHLLYLLRRTALVAAAAQQLPPGLAVAVPAV